MVLVLNDIECEKLVAAMDNEFSRELANNMCSSLQGLYGVKVNDNMYVLSIFPPTYPEYQERVNKVLANYNNKWQPGVAIDGIYCSDAFEVEDALNLDED